MNIIYKDSAQVADVSTADGIVVLYASAFNNLDAHGDIIAPGAYAKTIKEHGPGGTRRIKHLWMHWPDQVLGQPLELEEDHHGLRVVSKVSKTTLGKDALLLYMDGVITEHSVGISVIKRDDDTPGIIKEARLWEYSSVTWGANPLTPTVNVKALTGESGSAEIPTPIEVQIENAGRALSTPGLSDETCRQIEQWLQVAKGRATHDREPALDQASEDLDLLLLLSQSYLIKSKLQNHARKNDFGAAAEESP